MIEFIFWAAVFLLAFAYLGYALAVRIWAKLRPRPVKKAQITPRVSLIIAAYNEEKDILDKIRNSKELIYPPEKLEIIIVSDSSTDKTNDIVSANIDSRRIKLLALKQRRGKTGAQNAAVEECTGEILIFSDATSFYDKYAVSVMVQSFADPTVGCVGGKLVFFDKTQQEKSIAATKGLQSGFEEYLKIFESMIDSTFGVDGCIYAVRKESFVFLNDKLTSDFVLPLEIIQKGFRVVYEPGAVCLEQVAVDEKAEFFRKVRTVKAGVSGLISMRKLLLHWRNVFVPFGLIGHKVIRWFTLFLLVFIFCSDIHLVFRNHSVIYLIFLLLQLVFYCCALIGFLGRNIKLKIFRIPYHFMLFSLAAFIGIIKLLCEGSNEIWQTER